MIRDIDRILIDREQIDLRVRELADQIAATYPDPEHGITIVTILSGSIIFLADLMRYLPIKMKLGLITVSSYRGKSVIGETPQLLQGVNLDVAGEDVLVIDDILDTGRTLRMVVEELELRDAATIRTCVLLRKPSKAPKDFSADFVGFDVEDYFVVGYGLDYDGYYRNYPHIGVLREELYQ